MTYQEFKTELKKQLEERLEGKGIIVLIRKKVKNNGTEKEVLSFREEDINGVPEIHLDNLYEWYVENNEMESVVNFVLETLSLRAKISFDQIAGGWEDAKKKLSIRVVNYEWNKEGLEGYPHRKFLDMVILVQLKLNKDNRGTVSAIVNTDFLREWNITEEELLETACSNLKEEVFEVKNMKQVILELLDTEEKTEEEDCGMYILSNQSNVYGAAAFLRKDILDAFSEKHKCGFYILPSSVHELILLPNNGEWSTENLRDMVREINRTQVAEEERLSDEIYYFDYKEKKVKLV